MVSTVQLNYQMCNPQIRDYALNSRIHPIPSRFCTWLPNYYYEINFARLLLIRNLKYLKIKVVKGSVLL